MTGLERNTVYTPEELRKHDSQESAWIAIDGYVYDVTPFLEEHPGGKDIVMDHLGKEATAIFTNENVHAHSDAAFAMLAQYKIGTLRGCKVVDRTSRDEQLASMVDVTKPIIPQIPKLGAKYSEWIHGTTGLNKIIIFESFLEKFTRWPWWYIFVLWTPFIVWALNQNLKHNSAGSTAFMYVVGMLSWSIVEYVMHRFVFHMSTDTTMWNYFHFFAHGIHHLTPNDSTRLTFPPTFSFAIICLGMQVPRYLVSWDCGILAAYAGTATGFVLYDTCHYYFHHGEAKWMPLFLQKMKSSHLNHHYKDDSTNYGVTSPLFDYICGTLPKKTFRLA